MPFSFSHPAIVLPLKKVRPGWFSSTGLITGSIAPDLPYFLAMSGSWDFGHTLAGIFLLDLPLSFLAAIIFHQWFRNSLIRHLPSPLDRKYSDRLAFDFLTYLKKGWLLFAVSAFIGVVSHLVWDDFAKPEGLVLYYLAPSFLGHVVEVGPVEAPVYLLIERAGSIVGLAVMVWVVFRKTEQPVAAAPVSAGSKSLYWASIILVTAAIVAVTVWAGEEQRSVASFIVVCISAGLLALTLTTFLFRSFKPKPTRQK